jgi:hypothetical protein
MFKMRMFRAAKTTKSKAITHVCVSVFLLLSLAVMVLNVVYYPGSVDGSIEHQYSGNLLADRQDSGLKGPPFNPHYTHTRALLAERLSMDSGSNKIQQQTKPNPDKKPTSGYIVARINSSRSEFHSYTTELDLRIIVIVYNRARSLLKCLNAINNAQYGGDLVGVEVWVDPIEETNLPHAATLKTAQNFKFAHGQYNVRVHPTHVGIQGQWMNTWRPQNDTKEIALILEDDVTVSKYFWRWLKAAHQKYDQETYISGYGLSHPGISHASGTTLDVPTSIRIYAYRVLCTWGFSPHTAQWRKFQDWFASVEKLANFQPLVPGILPTVWFQGEQRFGRERHLWEMWHIFFTNENSLYTVMLNSLDRGLLAVNRHEPGLHDGRSGIGAREPLLTKWSETFVKFPDKITKIAYDGKIDER